MYSAKNCNSLIYVGRELTVEEQSDTKDEIVDFVDVIKPADPLSEHILGMKCCFKSVSEYLVSLNNSCLQNTSLVMFEELESFSADQWSKRIMIRDLYIKSYESDNTNNYIN